jgi:hypothetical protein
MNNLIESARTFATSAHQRIGQLRKYNNQPYDVHLHAVAKLVASVTDDPEMIAAAWLHDTVEDTSATLDDIAENFGTAVAELVEFLTDVSMPSDGNRAVRKSIDCDHSAQASARAKTVKLADLIDNCKDIAAHDERFARVYLVEMGALLKVLGDGDPTLLIEASRLHTKYAGKLGIEAVTQIELGEWAPQKARDVQAERQRRNVHCDLMDCLQLSDKAQILVDDPIAMERIGMKSKKLAKRTIKDLESLRNHLAHAQDIVQYDWPQIVRLSRRMEITARR